MIAQLFHQFLLLNFVTDHLERSGSLRPPPDVPFSKKPNRKRINVLIDSNQCLLGKCYIFRLKQPIYRLKQASTFPLSTDLHWTYILFLTLVEIIPQSMSIPFSHIFIILNKFENTVNHHFYFPLAVFLTSLVYFYQIFKVFICPHLSLLMKEKCLIYHSILGDKVLCLYFESKRYLSTYAVNEIYCLVRLYIQHKHICLNNSKH